MTAPSSSSSDPNDSQFLLRRFHLEDEIVFDRQAVDSSHTTTLSIHPLVHALGDALTTVDAALAEISPPLLGTALVRTSRDLAQAVGHLADQLERQSVDDRRALAQACLEDMRIPSQEEEWTTDDMIVALAGASSLLRDIQVGLQSMEQSEAEDIATVALTLARLFLASLKGLHSSLLLQDHEQLHQQQERTSHGQELEMLDQDTHDNNNTNTRNKETREPSSTNSRQKQQQQQQRMDRLRILWPPLGPAVAQACQWGNDQALQRPLLAVALGMTLWPAAVVTALVGTPLVAADAVLQHAYRSWQDTSLLQSVETTAFSLQQAATLTWMCTKLVSRKSWRVFHLQLQRQGGIGPLAQSWAGLAWERIQHPVETVTTVWQGLHWTVGAVQDQWNTFHPPHHHRGGGEQGLQEYDATPADAWRQ